MGVLFVMEIKYLGFNLYTMTLRQQQEMIYTRRLLLSGKRLYKHYLASGILGLTSVFLLFLVYGNSFHSFSRSFLLGLCIAFPLLAVLSLVFRYRALRLKEVRTGLPGDVNQALARETLRKLGWAVNAEEPGFIEAYTPVQLLTDFRTWSGEMVSVVITDGVLLLNSTGNLDRHTPPAVFSLGKHRQNVRQFIDTFELLSASRLGAGTVYA